MKYCPGHNISTPLSHNPLNVWRQRPCRASVLSAADDPPMACRTLQAQLQGAQQHHPSFEGLPGPQQNRDLYAASSSILATAPDLSAVTQAAAVPEPGPALQAPLPRPSSAFTMRLPVSAAAGNLNGSMPINGKPPKQFPHGQDQFGRTPASTFEAPSEASMRAYFHQPALRVRFSPTQFADMARRLQRTRSQA